MFYFRCKHKMLKYKLIPKILYFLYVFCIIYANCYQNFLLDKLKTLIKNNIVNYDIKSTNLRKKICIC